MRTEGSERRNGTHEGGDHPAPGELAVYHEGRLSPEEVETIQDHLARCADCTRALLALPHFYAELTAPGLEERPDVGAEASWQALRARLGSELSRPPALGTDRTDSLHAIPEREGSRWSRLVAAPATVYALAACLAACLVGFPLWIAFHERAAPPLAVVLPEGQSSRGAGAGQPLSVHFPRGGEGGAALLVLPLPPGPAFASYRVEIRTPDGANEYTAVVNPTPFIGPAAGGRRALTVALAAKVLPPGDYRLRVLGRRAGGEQAVEEGTLRILAP